MTTAPLLGPHGARRSSDEPYGTEDVPTGPPPRSSRLAAAAIDALIVLIPLFVGWSIVDALRDDNGGGQADRFVFGTIAVCVAAALFVWNRGYRDGNEGQSTGKRWLGLTLRDTSTHGPIGARRALRRQFGIDTSSSEVVRDKTAAAEGFEPVPKDGSVAAIRRRRLLGLAVLVVALVAGILASIAIGARPLTFAEIAHALLNSTGTDTDIIVRTLRIP
ncbi:MAG: RDD family protein, partial [Rhodococcus sp. (in: high G+C Gram-positive bacteria)]